MKRSPRSHGETVRETANMVSFMADVIGIRDDMFIGEGHKYQKTFMDALEEAARDNINQTAPDGSDLSATSTTRRSAWPICSTSSTTSAAWRTSRARRSP